MVNPVASQTLIISGHSSLSFRTRLMAWCSTRHQALPNPKDVGPLKALLAYDALVHPDHPLRRPDLDGIDLTLGMYNILHLLADRNALIRSLTHSSIHSFLSLFSFIHSFILKFVMCLFNHLSQGPSKTAKLACSSHLPRLSICGIGCTR